MKTLTGDKQRRSSTSTKKHGRELAVLERFVAVFCHANHGRKLHSSLCRECSDLLEYAKARLARCPFDPKPRCKACPAHCYKPAYRDRIREVMRFSGMHFVRRGRIDWLIRYFLS